MEKFIDIDNVYISDIVKNDEVNSKTCNLELVSKFKVVSLNEEGINACNSLKENRTTRTLLTIINSFISDLEYEFERI